MASTQKIMHSAPALPVPFRGARAAALALTAATAACAAGGDAPAEATAAGDLIGGFPASSAVLDAVGAIGRADGSGGFSPFCSGTLVGPTMVLTAKHCLAAQDASQLAFLIGPDAFAPTRVVAGRGAAVETTLSGGVIGFGSDVGILHLDTPVTDILVLPIAALTDDRIGTRMTALGYGVQNTDLTRGTRRSGSMTLKATGGSVYAAIFGAFDDFVARGAARLFPEVDAGTAPGRAELQAEFDSTRLLDGVEAWFGSGAGDAQACTGDGGGPIIARVDSRTTVFGVSSWGFGADAACTLDGSAFASINAAAIDFIDFQSHCPMIPRGGGCEGTVAVRCASANEGGRRVLRTDCADLGQACAVVDGTVACVDGP
jgi:hypothetical protein